jgi:hypothetical protein
VFLGELLRGLWRKNVRDLEVLRPEVDSGGSDLALEFKGVIRHVQLKSSFTGARRSDVTAHVKLLDRPSACILWIFFDPDNAYLSLEFRVRFGDEINSGITGEQVSRKPSPELLEQASGAAVLIERHVVDLAHIGVPPRSLI